MANNSSKKKLSLNPPTSSNTEKNIEEFINQAENHTKVAKQKQEQKSVEVLPWEMAGINANQMKSLRLSKYSS